MKQSSSEKSLQIIFSVTRNCPYTCAFCAMNASPTGKTEQKIINAAKNLASFVSKRPNISIDISGGDPLSPSAYSITTECLDILGHERCSISTTGVYIDHKKLDRLKKIDGFDFSIDISHRNKLQKDPRPPSYHSLGRSAIELIRERGIPVSVCTVLSSVDVVTQKNIREIQSYLDKYGITSWVWLPLYNIGRAIRCPQKKIDLSEKIILLQRALDPNKIQPKLQHTLMENCNCHAKDKVLYVSPEGILSACPWALQENGLPNPEFIMGDLTIEPIEKIIDRKWSSNNCPAIGSGFLLAEQ